MDNEDKLYYKQVLQGLSEEMPDEFFKLAQLVEVEQLEFLAPKDSSNNWRLVYLQWKVFWYLKMQDLQENICRIMRVQSRQFWKKKKKSTFWW